MGRRRGPGLVGAAARTAVVAGTASAVHGRVQHRQQQKYAAQDQQAYEAQQYEQQQYAQQAAPAAPAAPPEPAYMAEIEQLAQLRNQGIITGRGLRREEEADPRTLKRRVPLARILRLARAPRGAAAQAEALADRPEPALADRRHDDERRRVRHRLVRRGRHPGRVPQRRAGLERPQPAGAGGPRALAARLRPHPRVHRDGGAADELPSLPARPLALDAQRAIRDFPRVKRDLAPRVDPSLYPQIEGSTDSEVFFYLALTPVSRTTRSRRSRSRGHHRGDRAAARRRAPDPDDGGDDGRREHLGVPLLERGPFALALLQHADPDAAHALPRRRPFRGARRRVQARRLGAARQPRWAPGTRCRRRAAASSSRATTGSTTSGRRAWTRRSRRVEGAPAAGRRPPGPCRRLRRRRRAANATTRSGPTASAPPAPRGASRSRRRRSR